MARLHYALSGLALFLTAVFVTPQVVAQEPLLDLMESDLSQKDNNPDRVICERAVYSKAFDRWIKAYSDGRMKDATTEWDNVLIAAKGAEGLWELASLAAGRLEFLEPSQAKVVDKNGGINGGLKFILDETQHRLGPCTQAASIADYISFRYKNSKLYKNSIVYSQRALDIRLKILPEVDSHVFATYLELGKLHLANRDLAAATKNADKALDIATRAHSREAQYKARVLLGKISRAKGP